MAGPGLCLIMAFCREPDSTPFYPGVPAFFTEVRRAPGKSRAAALGLLTAWYSPRALVVRSSHERSVGVSICAAPKLACAASACTIPRRTCGLLLAAFDVHPRVAMRILRHSKIAITMELYTMVPDKATLAALKRLSDALSSADAALPDDVE